LDYNYVVPGTKNYYVYIVTNQSHNLYVGVTNKIRRRVGEHKNGLTKGFTHRYNIDTLVYVEAFSDIGFAIAREKQIKYWRREKKLRLINQENPDWRDLSDGL
jgi:putative endonuclease